MTVNVNFQVMVLFEDVEHFSCIADGNVKISDRFTQGLYLELKSKDIFSHFNISNRNGFLFSEVGVPLISSANR
jgi:hypothetical protein